MKTLFTICARAGSKGVANKNVRIFCGKPIVYYTLAIYEKYLQKYKNTENEIDLAVNTDSGQLVEQINARDIEYFLVKRKKELAGDRVAKVSVIQDTFLETEKSRNKQYDLVIDLDITSPLRTLADVEGVIGKVTQNEKCNFAYSVVEARRNPYFNMVCKNENGFFDKVIPSDYVARQQAPECFDMNASIYAYAREYLMDARTENRFALVWKMEDNGVLDIDSENDFELMELIADYCWKKGRYLDII